MVFIWYEVFLYYHLCFDREFVLCCRSADRGLHGGLLYALQQQEEEEGEVSGLDREYSALTSQQAAKEKPNQFMHSKLELSNHSKLPRQLRHSW